MKDQKNNNNTQNQDNGVKPDDQIDGIDSEMEARIQELAAAIDQVEDEKLELLNKLKKALADYQNLEKALDSRVELKIAHLKRNLAGIIIPIVDDLKFAVDASETLEKSPAVAAWIDGTVSTVEKIKDALTELGIEIIEVKQGDVYDSSMHEALSMVPHELPQNTIVEMLQPGYRMGEIVVRPARVLVSMAAV